MAAKRETLPHLFDTVKAKFPKSLGPHSWYLVAVSMPPLHSFSLFTFGHRRADGQHPLGVRSHHQFAPLKLRPTLDLSNTAARISNSRGTTSSEQTSARVSAEAVGYHWSTQDCYRGIRFDQGRKAWGCGLGVFQVCDAQVSVCDTLPV